VHGSSGFCAAPVREPLNVMRTSAPSYEGWGMRRLNSESWARRESLQVIIESSGSQVHEMKRGGAPLARGRGEFVRVRGPEGDAACAAAMAEPQVRPSAEGADVS
jgi:hypothetical protein